MKFLLNFLFLYLPNLTLLTSSPIMALNKIVERTLPSLAAMSQNQYIFNMSYEFLNTKNVPHLC
jgi:hypothetical protein